MRILVLLVLLTAVSANATSQGTTDDRVATVRTFFIERVTTPDYTSATARILSGDSLRDEGIRFFDELSAASGNSIIERYRLMQSYAHVRTLLPDSLRERVERIWSDTPLVPPLNEHERVAYQTALYMFTVLHTGAAVFNGRPVEENRRDAQDFLMHWIDETVRYGQREFDSPTYGPLFLSAMVLLRDFAPDELFARHAEIMAQWLLADYAQDNLGGSMVGAHARENLFSARQPFASEMTPLSWMYFDEGPETFGRDQYFLALSSFRPHPAVVRLATRRTEAFTSIELKRSARRYRHYTGREELARRYTYISPLFAMGSVSGGLLQYSEQHTWDVTWPGIQSAFTMFTMHPYADAVSLIDFLPHSEQVASRLVLSRDPYFGSVTKTTGGSPYEDVFQHENTLIAMYDVREAQRFPVIAGFLPAYTDAFEYDSTGSGWLTMRSGDVYLAIFPFTTFSVTAALEGEQQVGQWMLSREPVTGLVVHVEGRNTAGPYEQFVSRIVATRPDLSEFSASRRVRYTTPGGDELDCTFLGAQFVNGTRAETDRSKLFDSPLLTSYYGSGVMTIHDEDGDVIIDTQTLTISEQ